MPPRTVAIRVPLVDDHAMLAKVGLASRTQAALLAVQNGIDQAT